MNIKIKMTLSSNENLKSIEKKIEKVNETKQQFENKILAKIGDVLLNELFSLRSNENDSIPDQKKLITIKIPYEIRSFIEQINLDNIIIETAILYFFYNINQLTEKLEKKYEENREILINKIEELGFSLKSFDFFNTIHKSDYLIINFLIPDYFEEKFSLLEENYDCIIIYGILAILKWLNLFDSSQEIILQKYEHYFLESTRNFI